jgi:hypothetical protein
MSPAYTLIKPLPSLHRYTIHDLYFLYLNDSPQLSWHRRFSCDRVDGATVRLMHHPWSRPLYQVAFEAVTDVDRSRFHDMFRRGAEGDVGELVLRYLRTVRRSSGASL